MLRRFRYDGAVGMMPVAATAATALPQLMMAFRSAILLILFADIYAADAASLRPASCHCLRHMPCFIHYNITLRCH